MENKMVAKRFYLNRIYKFFLGEKSSKQFIRYLIIGFSSFLLEYLLFFTLFKLLNINVLISNSIAIFIVFWFNFLLNKYWSFKSKENLFKQLIMYLLLFVFNITISNLFIYEASIIINMSPLISKVLIMGLIVIWNFILYKKVIYK